MSILLGKISEQTRLRALTLLLLQCPKNTCQSNICLYSRENNNLMLYYNNNYYDKISRGNRRALSLSSHWSDHSTAGNFNHTAVIIISFDISSGHAYAWNWETERGKGIVESGK